MSANISNVINVTLNESAELADRDQMNVVAIMTSQQDGTISTANRYAIYTDIASVITDFGTSSAMADYATTFFATSPNAVNASGALVAGYWRGAQETVAATAGTLTGEQITEATLIDSLQEIEDGSFSIDIDGATEAITALDFQESTTMTEVIAVLNAKISGGVASYSDQRIIITSSTTGVTSLVTFPVAGATGTFVGILLALSTGTGAYIVDGVASVVLSVETKTAGITALKAAINVKGAMFIDKPSDADVTLLATWAQANDVLMYDVFNDTDNLLVDTTNVVWATKLSGFTNYRMLFSKSGNRKLASSYMARMHSVNFGAENSTFTMHLKELSVSAEDYTQTQITNAKTVGLDLYTTIKNTSVILTSGKNDFADNRYNIIAFIDALQTDMYNLLRSTATKIPQTLQGVNRLVDQAEKTSREFVRAGMLAPGTWTSSDFFGNQETFDNNIENNGFYWLAGSLADQSASDRAARKSPVLQGAIKNSGAIHSAEIIVNFNL